MKKHNKEGTPIYTSWAGMKTRCTNKKCTGYENYGGRGISVCRRWLKFENFYKDMGERPQSKSLDRINNDGNYEPGNCRWATRKEQSNNRRSTMFVSINKKQVSFTFLAKFFKIKKQTLQARISRGWSLKRALTHK